MKSKLKIKPVRILHIFIPHITQRQDLLVIIWSEKYLSLLLEYKMVSFRPAIEYLDAYKVLITAQWTHQLISKSLYLNFIPLSAIF